MRTEEQTMDKPTETVLELTDVRKVYGDFEAVRGVSFAVSRGECFGL